MDNTAAIVLHLQKHTDKMSVLHLYTQDRGRVACLVYGKKYNNILQPLSLIEIEYHYQANQNFAKLKNATLLHIPTKTNSDMRRHTVALFISEVLYRILKHPLSDEQLFYYLTSVVKELDETSTPENTHLLFLMNFVNYLGITPEWVGDGRYLDMQSGEQQNYQPTHTDYFDSTELAALNGIIAQNNYLITRKMRQQLLDKLCRYYALHLSDFQTPKALSILTEIFD